MTSEHNREVPQTGGSGCQHCRPPEAPVVDGAKIVKIRLFGEQDFPQFEVNGIDDYDYSALPLSPDAKSLIDQWLTAGRLGSDVPYDQVVVAALRAMGAITRELGPSVEILFDTYDPEVGRWHSVVGCYIP